MPKKQATEDMQPKRILVLGSTPHTRLVKAFEWDKLPKDLNVSDFDILVMDFTPFADEEFAHGINIDLIPSWQQFARLLFAANSEIIVIGSPAFYLGSNPYLPSTWWLPFSPHFVYEVGEAIRNVNQQFASYFEMVRQWTFYFEGFEQPHPDLVEMYVGVGAPGMNAIVPKLGSIAETRAGRPISFSLGFDATRIVRTRWSEEATGTSRIAPSGTVIWLPVPTEASAYEAIDLILRERYGLCFETEPPKWASAFPLPAELPIESIIKEKETAITRINNELAEARASLARVSRFRKMLHEQGEDILEPIVRDALRELSVGVEDAKTKGREDGRLTDPFGRKGMLEIKGRTGSLSLFSTVRL